MTVKYEAPPNLQENERNIYSILQKIDAFNLYKRGLKPAEEAEGSSSSKGEVNLKYKAILAALYIFMFPLTFYVNF